MTGLPPPGPRKLGLVIDLDICVGCHACAVNCKEWNSGGHMAPLTDEDPYGPNPLGVWFNRVHSFEAGEGEESRTVHFPRSCLHCEQPACVATCPVSARHFGDLGDPESEVSKLVVERGGYELMPEMRYGPVNRYLPPRPRQNQTTGAGAVDAPAQEPAACVPVSSIPEGAPPFLRWIDRVLSR